MTQRILIVEDEHALAGALAVVCRRLGGEPTLVASGRQAREELAGGGFAVVIVDIGLPDMNGLELLERCGKARALVITAHGNLENAIAARRRGATQYLVKPLDLHEFQRTLQDLLPQNAPSAGEIHPASADESNGLLIGGAPAMQRAFVEIAHACASDAPVLITGPTGTGKTHTARVIHANSARRAGPFVALSCGALPEQLLESELFGHEKNAFTGALTSRPGHIERAAGGTLFLDEIGDVSPAVQAKLLRFVEERTFTRVGGREDLRIDLRLITATNRDLRQETSAGRFREDLYYRLHVLEIELPALHRRKEDIPALAAFFLGSLRPGRPPRLSTGALDVLARFDWPGNVRELRNAIERALAVCPGTVILPQHLPREIRQQVERSSAETEQLAAAVDNWLRARIATGATYYELHDELETAVLKTLLRHFDNKPTVLAREVKMNRATLLKKRQRMGLTA